LDRGALETSDARDDVDGVAAGAGADVLAGGAGGAGFAAATFFWQALKLTPSASTAIPANNLFFMELSYVPNYTNTYRME
jgi:hypothetical protein